MRPTNQPRVRARDVPHADLRISQSVITGLQHSPDPGGHRRPSRRRRRSGSGARRSPGGRPCGCGGRRGRGGAGRSGSPRCSSATKLPAAPIAAVTAAVDPLHLGEEGPDSVGAEVEEGHDVGARARPACGPGTAGRWSRKAKTSSVSWTTSGRRGRRRRSRRTGRRRGPRPGRPATRATRTAAAGGGGGLLGRHHHLAPEVADLFAPLVEAPGLDGDDPAVGLARRRLRLEHLGLGVDGVAVEGRLLVLELLDLEVGDGGAAHVGDAHAEHHRVHEVADHHVLAELGLRSRRTRRRGGAGGGSS